MEELKLLIEMVANLPAMALWVLVGFWAYKVIIVGSIYGVIRFVVTKLVEWRTFVPPVRPVEYKMNGLLINEETTLALTAQIMRLSKTRGYLHQSDVFRLKEAIDGMSASESK